MEKLTDGELAQLISAINKAETTRPQPAIYYNKCEGGNENMPDFSNCIKSGNGKLYCYDYVIHQMIQLQITPIRITELPEDVLEIMLLSKYQNNKSE